MYFKLAYRILGEMITLHQIMVIVALLTKLHPSVDLELLGRVLVLLWPIFNNSIIRVI
jgi:hypothetical protein